MHRRRYLVALGAVTSLAGCSSSGSSGDSVASVGETQSEDGVSVAVTDVVSSAAYEIEPGYDAGQEPKMTGAQEVAILADIEVSIDDTSTIINPTERVALSAPDSDFEPNRESGSIEYPTTGEMFDFSILETEDSRSGWALFITGRESIEGLNFEWETTSDNLLEWDLDLDAENLPELSVADHEIPGEVELFETAEFTVTVANDGGSTGRFVEPVFREHPDEGPWIDLEIGPGETAESSIEIDPQNTFVDNESIDVQIGDTRDTIEWVTPTRELGEPYTVTGGLEVSVVDWRTATSVERESNLSLYDSIEYNPDDGEQLVFLKLRSYNGDSSDRTPMDGSVQFRDGDSSISTEVEYPSFSSDPADFLDPDLTAYRDQTLGPSEEVVGWVLCRVQTTEELSGKSVLWERGFGSDDVEPIGIKAQWTL